MAWMHPIHMSSGGHELVGRCQDQTRKLGNSNLRLLPGICLLCEAKEGDGLYQCWCGGWLQDLLVHSQGEVSSLAMHLPGEKTLLYTPEGTHNPLQG